MHNWRLLLLAFLAAFQPISTFTGRDHVDGRQQCSDRPLLRDTEHLYGTYRSSKVASQERLNHRETRDVRFENRRYGVRDTDSLTPPAERQIFAEHEVARQRPEPARSTRAQYRVREGRERLSDTRDRIAHLGRARNSRENEDRHISVRDSNRRERIQEISDERNTRVSRIVRQDVRDTYKSMDRLSDVKRGECSFKDERTRLSVDDRRKARRTRDYIGQPKKNAEIREARLSLKRQRDEVTRRESSRNRIQERIGQEDRQISSIGDLRLQPQERRSLDTISEDNKRSSSLNRKLERQEVAHRERTGRSTIHRDVEDSQTRSRNLEAGAIRTQRSNNRESRVDSREEQRSSSEESRLNERDSRSRNVDLRETSMKRTVHFEIRNYKKGVRLPNREAGRNEERSVNEKESQRIHENNRDTEQRKMSSDGRIDYDIEIRKTEKSRNREYRHTAGVDSRRSRESNRNLDKRESQTNERLDFSRVTTTDNRKESNRFSRSAERIASLELRRESQRFRENSRDIERLINERLDTARDDRREFRSVDSRRVIERYMSRQERRSNDRLNNNRDGRVQLRQSDLGVRRVYTRRTNKDQQRDSNERINVYSENRIDSTRQDPKVERVTALEARRADSRKNNERDFGRIRENYPNIDRQERRTDDRYVKSQDSRSQFTRSVDRLSNSESRRDDSRRHDERESDRIRLNNRNMKRSESGAAYRQDNRLTRTGDRVVNSETRLVGSKTGSLETSRDMTHSERRSNDLANDVRRPSRSTERVADFESRRVETRRFRESNRNMERRESRTSDGFETSLDSLNRVTKSANRVANLENRRIESRNLHDPKSQRILGTREASRVAKSENSRDRNKHFEARNIEDFALERDGIESRIRSKLDVTRTRGSWSLIEKDVEDSKPCPINWQYIFYTLQGIYLSSMLLQVFGSDKKKDGFHGFWESTKKVIKVD